MLFLKGPDEQSFWIHVFSLAGHFLIPLTCNVQHVIGNFDWDNIIPVSVTYLWRNETLSSQKKKIDACGARGSNQMKKKTLGTWELFLLADTPLSKK